MKQFIKSNLILLIVVVIGLVTALSCIGTRFVVESNNDKYDIVLDYNEIEEMAGQSNHDVSWWLSKFNAIGISKVGLAEESFATLVENKDVPVSATIMDIVMREAGWQNNYPKEFIDNITAKGFTKHDLLVEAASKESFDFIKNAVTERYQPKKYYYLETADGGYLMLTGKASETLYTEKYKLMSSKKKGFMEKDEIASSKLMYLNLGIMPSKLKAVQDLGMQVIPRTASYDGWNDTKYANAVIASYERMGVIPEYLIVGGECVMGYDKGANVAKDYINKNKITLGLIENTTQLQNILQYGVNNIVESTDYDAVRIFSVWDYIQNRYKYYGYKGAEEIENTLFRAVTERNVRLIYYKPIKEYKDQHVYVTDFKVYENMFKNLEVRLAEHGIHYAKADETATVMSSIQVNIWKKILMALGCAAAAILLIKAVLPIRRKGEAVLCALGVLAVLGVAGVFPNYLGLLTSFASAVIFACLAILLYTRQSRLCEENLSKDEKLSKIIFVGVCTLIGSVIIAFVGGMMTAAPISSIGYMLEIDIFRGVKVAQLLPIAFFLVAYLSYFGFGDAKKKIGSLECKDLKNLLNANIKIWMVFIGVAALGVGYYYIARTGHGTGVEVSGLEMLFRNTLEDHLMARPRSKEFLFAFPAVMMMVYTSARKFKLWPVLFGVASVIGMTSVVNTFMHIRTPLYLGFIRTGYSLLFGVILGIVAIVVFELIYRGYKRVEERLN